MITGLKYLQFRVLALSAAIAAFAAPAGAAVLEISAPGFFRHGAPAPDEVNQGVLTNAVGKYFSAVSFPVSGQKVCRFSLVFGDNDADFNITAKLFRRAVNLGGPVFGANVLMAQVRSGGAQPNVRRASDTTIASNTIATQSAFYTVEIQIPGGALDPIGVQIEYKPSC